MKVMTVIITVLLCSCTTIQASAPGEELQPITEMQEPDVIDKPVIALPEEPAPEPEPTTDSFVYIEYFTYNGTTHNPGIMTEEEQHYTYDLCQEYGLDFNIIMGLMGAESGWNLYIRSTSGYASAGSISIRYHYDRMLSLGLDLNDPLDGIECICVILSEKLTAYGDYSMAIMAYNKGDAGAQKYFKKGVYNTLYTEKVLGFAEAIKEERTK